MDLKQIRAFMATYEERSVTRAAHRLNVVQPAVSMQIRRLEELHGVALFSRSSHGLSPTPFAAELYRSCCRVAAELEQVEGLLSSATGRTLGEISVGAPPSLALSVLGEIIAEFHAAAPAARVRIHEGYSAHLQDWLIGDAIDFAVMTGLGEDDRLTTAPLLRDPLALIASARAAKTLGPAIEAKALSELPLVLPTKRHTLRALIDSELDRVGLAVDPELEIDSLAIVLSLLESGEWYSVLPALSVAGGTAAQRFVAVPIVEPGLERELVIAHKTARPLDETARAFIGLLSDALKSR